MQKTALFFDEKNILFDKKMIFSQKVARIVRYFFLFFWALFTSEIFIY